MSEKVPEKTPEEKVRAFCGFFCLFLAICFFLTGCGSREEPQKTEEKTVLAFAWCGDEAVHRATLEAVRAYEAIHPEIEIQTEFWDEANYYQRISTLMANDEAPDIYQFRYSWYERSSRDALAGPADLAGLGMDFSGVEDLLEECTTGDGRVILYPLALDGDCLIINCDFFDAYQIPTEDTFSWESFLKKGVRIHVQNATDYFLEASVDELSEVLLPAHLVQQTGKNMLSDEGGFQFDSRQLTKTMDYLLRLYDSNALARVPEEVMVTGNSGENSKWEKGKVGVRLGNLAQYAGLRGKTEFPIAVLPLPQNPDPACSGVNYQVRSGLAVNENTLHSREAADFLRWFTGSEEAADILGLTRGIPANKNQRRYLTDQGVLDEELLAIEALLEEDSYQMNVKSSDMEFAMLCKSALISLVGGDLTGEGAARQIMTEWANLW